MAFALLSTIACTDSAPPAKSGSADPANAGSDEGDATGADGTPAGPARDAGKGTSPGTPATNGTTKPGDMSSAKSDSGSAKPAPTTDAGSTGGTAAAGADGGSAQAPDSGSDPMTPPLDIPTPMTEPLVWGFGIGITDVPAATKFYTSVMQMTVEKDGIKRDDRTETILYGTQAKRGARLLLMKFDDMRNTRKITSKIVWQAQNASAVDSAASKYPDYVSRLNLGIVQFDGPETYIHEVGGVFDDGGAGISVPYPVALGFAVSDLPASRKFYTSLGMTESSIGSFGVTDATGMGNITEYSVKFATGMGLVLQQWTPMRNAKNNPIKAVLFVPDAKAMADKVVAGGGKIVKEAERLPGYDNRLVIVTSDPDGYILELVQ